VLHDLARSIDYPFPARHGFAIVYVSL
jgi:hypothetical protein